VHVLAVRIPPVRPPSPFFRLPLLHARARRENPASCAMTCLPHTDRCPLACALHPGAAVGAGPPTPSLSLRACRLPHPTIGCRSGVHYASGEQEASRQTRPIGHASAHCCAPRAHPDNHAHSVIGHPRWSPQQAAPTTPSSRALYKGFTLCPHTPSRSRHSPTMSVVVPYFLPQTRCCH
jgi:hypothetical protein